MAGGNALLFVAVALISILAEVSIVFSVVPLLSKKLGSTWVSSFIDYGSTALVVPDIQLACSLLLFKGIHPVPPAVSFGTDLRYHPALSTFTLAITNRYFYETIIHVFLLLSANRRGEYAQRMS
jgi:hypothetical protein